MLLSEPPELRRLGGGLSRGPACLAHSAVGGLLVMVWLSEALSWRWSHMAHVSCVRSQQLLWPLRSEVTVVALWWAGLLL